MKRDPLMTRRSVIMRKRSVVGIECLGSPGFKAFLVDLKGTSYFLELNLKYRLIDTLP
jgi:hypothetical protein